MKCVYHGSHVSDLKLVNPNKSTHGEEWVYATKSECIAVIFLKQYGNDFTYALSGEGTKENPAVLVERKPGMFKKMFSNGGSVYVLSGNDFLEGKTSWSAEVISNKPQAVIEERKIASIFEELLKFASKGELIIYNYPNRPDFIPLDNSDLIDKYIRFYKNGFPQYIDGLIKAYPEFKEEIGKRIKKIEKT